MFELASKTKLRFTSAKGVLDVESLWDLPLTELNEIAKKVNTQLKQLDDEDFITGESVVSKEKDLGQLRLDILKHIIKTKIEIRDAKKLEKEKSERKAKILEIIASKQDASLQDKSVEELFALLDQ